MLVFDDQTIAGNVSSVLYSKNALDCQVNQKIPKKIKFHERNERFLLFNGDYWVSSFRLITLYCGVLVLKRNFCESLHK